MSYAKEKAKKDTNRINKSKVETEGQGETVSAQVGSYRICRVEFDECLIRAGRIPGIALRLFHHGFESANAYALRKLLLERIQLHLRLSVLKQEKYTAENRRTFASVRLCKSSAASRICSLSVHTTMITKRMTEGLHGVSCQIYVAYNYSLGNNTNIKW